MSAVQGVLLERYDTISSMGILRTGNWELETGIACPNLSGPVRVQIRVHIHRPRPPSWILLLCTVPPVRRKKNRDEDEQLQGQENQDKGEGRDWGREVWH